MRRLGWAAFLLLTTSVFVIASTPSVTFQEYSLPLQVTERVTIDNGFRVNLAVQEPEWNTVALSESGIPLQIAEYTNSGGLEVEGRPIVPIVGRMFRLPATGGARVEVVSADYETLTDIDYAAWFGTEEFDDFGQELDIVDEWYPANIAEIGEPAIFHDFRVSNMVTFPVQVNTARREARVYHNIEVEIHYDVEDTRNELPHQPTRISEAFLPWYRVLLDWSDSELDEFETYYGHVQVVLQDNETLFAMMEPWFEWKRQKGWIIETITQDDCSWTNTGIQQELRQRYQTAETPFDYVVIVGDDAGSFSVPPGTGTGYGSGDHDYALVAGTDQLVDVAIGRISVETNTQVIAYVNKVLDYERDPDMNNTDWYEEGHVAVASDHSGIGTVFTGRYGKEAMYAIGYDTVTEAYVSPWGPYSSGTQVNNYSVSRFAEGISFYSCRGYLGAGLQTGTIGSLNNPSMCPVVIDLTCGTGNWAGGYGINEAYMRAGTPTSPRGSIGAVGNATSGTNPRFNNSLAGGGMYAMFVLRNPFLGDMHFGGKINIWNNFNGFDSGGLSSFNDWFNLMGDPTVMVWTSVPQDLTVTASPVIELGANSYEVTVMDGALPLEDAWVTLYKVDDDEEIIAHGKTNSDGTIILDAPVRFAGEAMLTVTMQNFEPYRQEIDIVSPEDGIGYISIGILDNGSSGTNGNGNMIPEAGETIGLSFTAKNYGEAAQSGVTLSASADDDWIESVSGTVTFGTIEPDAEADGAGLILVAIDSDAQNDWIAHLSLEFEGSIDSYTDGYPLSISAAEYALVDVNYLNGAIDPGETGNITIEVMNIGGSDATSPVGHLYSLDPFLGIVTNEANYPSLDRGETGTGGTFTVSAHPETFPGRQARAILVLASDEDQIDTVYVNITLGNRSGSDPSGPDNYGYFAFDNTDTDYEMAPEYDWIEINPSASNNDYDGDMLDIHDGGDDQDDATSVQLPFPIIYYGRIFSEMTVCSNGWVAMGGQVDLPNSRNWVIPSPLGPDYMIAPYWDERFVPGNNTSAVYDYYDEENGRYIIEWYQTRDYQNSNPCTFEVIFYTQEARPTYTGDTDFIFQYDGMSHTQGASWNTSSDTYWWTTGIENGNQTDGIQLWYWNVGEPGSASITDGRAILFTTNVALITGSVDGQVTDLETGDPVESALVRTDDWVYSTTTDNNGNFLLNEVIIGEHHIVVEAIGYNPATSVEITVAEAETTTVDFSLTHPEFVITPDSIFQLILPQSQEQVVLQIDNNGNGPLSYAVELDFQGPTTTASNNPGDRGPVRNTDELDDPWDWIFTFNLTSAETRNRGVAFDGVDFWVSGSNSYDTEGYNKLYRYNASGELIGVYDQPVENRTAIGFYGLTWDGEYLYGVDNSYMYKMEISEDAVELAESVEVPIPSARYITYDPVRDLFWMGDLTTNIRGVSRSGETVQQITQDFYPRGAGWFPSDENDYNLYFIAQAAGTNVTQVIKMNPDLRAHQVVYTFESDAVPSGTDATNEWNPLIFSLISVMDDGSQDFVQMWEIERNREWIHIDPEEGVVEAGGQASVTIDLDSGTLPLGVYSVWLRFDHDAIQQQTFVPLVMEVSETGIENPDASLPLEWTFDGAYPNPFNPSVNIAFTLQENVNVQARIFNVLGQQVAVLANQPMNAGHHALTFNGHDLSSGVYFLRLDAGPLHHTQKLLLMK